MQARRPRIPKPLWLVGVMLMASSVLLGGCGERPPSISFAPNGTDDQQKPDFASVEYHFPLTPADLQKITPKNLAALTQEQIDQVYARLTAGPIPDGPFDGKVLWPKGSSGKFRAAEILGGLTDVAVNLQGKKLEAMVSVLWKGKMFYREQRMLRNRIEDLKILKSVLGSDLGRLPKIKTSVKGSDAWLLFPAKLYCGQSLLDARRESVIIDYAFNDELEGYHELPDFLAGRRGFKVRDEIRRVRPGFYLGRAYLDRAFVLNFSLYNEALAGRDGAAFLKTGQRDEDCWGGTQQPHVTTTAAAK